MTSKSDQGCILLVEDDDKMRKLCARILESLEYRVVQVPSAPDALAAASSQQFDLLLTDYMMPGMTGDELVTALKQTQPDIVPIIMTAYPSTDLAVSSLRLGVYEFLTKPFAVDDLRQALDRVRARREEEAARFGRHFADALVNQLQEQGDTFDILASIQQLLPEPGDAVKPVAQVSRKESTLLLVEPAPTNANLLKASPRYADLRTLHAATRVLNRHLQGDGLQVKLALTTRLIDCVGHMVSSAGSTCGVVFGPNLAGLTPGIVQLAVDALPGRPVIVCASDGVDEHEVEQAGAIWFAPVDEEGVRARWTETLARRVRPTLALEHKPSQHAVGAPDLDRSLLRLLSCSEHELMSSLENQQSCFTSVLIDEASRSPRGNKAVPQTAEDAADIIGSGGVRRIAALHVLVGMTNQLTRNSGFDVDGFLRHQIARACCARLLAVNVDNPATPQERHLLASGAAVVMKRALQRLQLWKTLPAPADLEPFVTGLLFGAGCVQLRQRYGQVWLLALHKLEVSDWGTGVGEALKRVTGLDLWQATAATVADWGLPDSAAQAVSTPPSADSAAGWQDVLLLAEAVAQVVCPFPARIDIPGVFRKQHLTQVRTDRLPNPLLRSAEEALGIFRRRLLAAPGADSWDQARSTIMPEGRLMQDLTRQVPALQASAARMDIDMEDIGALALAFGESWRGPVDRHLAMTDSIRKRTKS